MRSFHIKQGLDTTTYGDVGFAKTFKIPSVDENRKPFKDGTKFSISSTLTSLDKTTGKTRVATFEEENSTGNLIDVLSHYGGATSIEEMVRFNEKN